MTMQMETRTDMRLDDIVYDTVVAMGGSFRVNRGEDFVNSVGRIVVNGNRKVLSAELPEGESHSLRALPEKVSHRAAYEAVCRLVQEGRLVRSSDEDYLLQYGSRPVPVKIPYAIAEFSAVP